MSWAILKRSENQLDGKREYLAGRFSVGCGAVPASLAGYTTMVFETREQARWWVRHYCTDLRKRPDLRKEPHGWKPPRVVKVDVVVSVR